MSNFVEVKNTKGETYLINTKSIKEIKNINGVHPGCKIFLFGEVEPVLVTTSYQDIRTALLG